MTTQEREILAFIEKHQPVAIGTIRDCFPKWGIEGIVGKLELEELVTKKLRPTVHGATWFYSIGGTHGQKTKE